MTEASLVPSALLVREREAARLLSIGTRKLWDLTEPRGPIPVVWIGGCKCYPVSGLKEWISLGCPSVAPTMTGREGE